MAILRSKAFLPWTEAMSGGPGDPPVTPGEWISARISATLIGATLGVLIGSGFVVMQIGRR